MIVTESWRQVPWARAYEVSDVGNVRRRINITHPERNRPYVYLRPETDKDGYRRISLNRKHYLVHRLVYALFVGELVEGLVVCHIDGTQTNNAPSNLLQASQKENIAHKAIHGTQQIGERHGRSKHTTELAHRVHEALAIVPRSATGRLKRGASIAVARQTGAPLSLVRDISANKTWRHAKC